MINKKELCKRFYIQNLKNVTCIKSRFHICSFFPEAKERNLDLNMDLNNITISKENQERRFAKKTGSHCDKTLIWQIKKIKKERKRPGH